jgi:hypothetical protein
VIFPGRSLEIICQMPPWLIDFPSRPLKGRLDLPCPRAIAGSAAIALVSMGSTAQAMEIRQFDKMADRDQVDYLDGLITGAEKVLTDAGKPALAAQVEHLFTTKLGNDADTIGMVEFERNLAITRDDNAHHSQDQPSEVEDVMIITLENNHIPLPDSFYDVNKNFRPKLPPKK